MRHVRIIVHGARSDVPELRSIVEALRASGDLVVDVRPTWEPGDTVSIAAEAAALGVDVVVAAGGDGQLHEVVNGVAKLPKRPAVGVIPLGTANDFAHVAQVSPADIEAIVAALRGPSRPVDIIHAEDHFFVNVATGGFAVSQDSSVPEGLKSMFGGLAYLLSGVANLTAADAQSVLLRGPDFEWSGSFYGFAVANARCAGGGHRIAPDAVIDDGLLDVVVVPSEQSIFDSIRIGADLTVEADERYACRWQVPWVEVDGDDLRLNLDGEPHEVHGCVRFEVLPGHIEMCLPDGPLLGRSSS